MNNWETERKRLAHRRRRLIMNNDGDDVFLARESTPDAFLAERCRGLEGSHVDAIAYCTTVNYRLFTHATKVAHRFAGVDEYAFPRNHAQALIDQGRDNLQLVVDFCRRNSMEAFWSLRMNDGHDNWYPSMLSAEKKEHPELLLFRKEDVGRPRLNFVEPHMIATAVDYEQPEVRRQQLAVIREICDGYDVDGIELDFMRGPYFFRPTLEGRPVGSKHLAIMTEFMRNVRGIAEEAGRRRNRPILIASRVLATETLNLNIGLDIRQWLEQDLLDLVVASLELWSFTGSLELEELVNLARRSETPIYACLTPWDIPAAHGNDYLPGWVGAACNAWRSGVDGLYTFNQFDSKAAMWRVIGDPMALATLDKVYAVDNVGDRCRVYEQSVLREGRLPVEMSPGRERKVILPVSDDFPAVMRKGQKPDLTLRFKVEKLTYSDEVEFKLNGRTLDFEVVYSTEGISPVAVGTFLLRSRPHSEEFILGKNAFSALLKKRCPAAEGVPVVSELQLWIRYTR